MLALLLMLLGCNDKGNNVEKIIFSANNGEIVFQRTYKILNVPDSLVLGNVDQIKFSNDQIFLLTSQSGSGELHSFDNTGKYLGKFGDYGRGQGEYLMPTSFSIYKGEIYVVDCSKRSVISYDIKTFKFLKEYKLPIELSSIAYLNDNQIVSYGQMNDAYFTYMNSEYQIERDFVKNFRGSEYSGYNTGTYDPMCNVGEKIMLYTPFATIIYEATEKGIAPKYSLELANFEMPDKDFILKISQSPNFFVDLINSGSISYYTYFETKQAMLVSFFVKGERYTGYYKKGDIEGTVSKTDKLYDGGNIVGVYGDYFVAYVDVVEENIPKNDIILLLIK